MTTSTNQFPGSLEVAGIISMIPATGYVRLPQIIGDRKANPPIVGPIPIGKSQWWEWVKAGIAPAPIKWGPSTTVWRAEEIHKLIDELGTHTASAAGNRGVQLSALRAQRGSAKAAA